MASVFEYWESKADKKFWFHLKETGNSEIILASTEGYETETGCTKGIASTKANAPYDYNYKKSEGIDNKYYFILRAGNYEPVSRSEGYNTSSGRDRGIENCKREAPSAPVKKIIKV